jgi:hypothetical protein
MNKRRLHNKDVQHQSQVESVKNHQYQYKNFDCSLNSEIDDSDSDGNHCDLSKTANLNKKNEIKKGGVKRLASSLSSFSLSEHEHQRKQSIRWSQSITPKTILSSYSSNSVSPLQSSDDDQSGSDDPPQQQTNDSQQHQQVINKLSVLENLIRDISNKFNERPAIESYIVRDHQDNDVDLIEITGVDIYKYAARVLSTLFAATEIQQGAIEPTKMCKFPALDSVRIGFLKSNNLFTK